MNDSQNNIPFGVTFADTSVLITKVDPQYSAETQVSSNALDLATSTYLKWTEDSDK